jgi:hypothetical protein
LPRAHKQQQQLPAMARPLLLLVQAEAGRTTTSSHAAAGAAPLLLVLVAAAAAATVVVSLCTSSKPWKQGRVLRGGSPPELEEKAGASGGSFVGKKQLLASLSGIGGKKQLLATLSGKAAAVARMVSWNKRSPPPEAGWGSSSASDDDEEALWKKTIIMGDKCRPLEFSGQIAYDSDGNRLPPPAESIEKSAATGADDE